MESVGDKKPWAVDRERRASGLRVVLPKRTYVLPWAQFLYAEGARTACGQCSACTTSSRQGVGSMRCWRIWPHKVVTVLQQPLRAETFLPHPVHACRPWKFAGLRGVGPRDRR